MDWSPLDSSHPVISGVIQKWQALLRGEHPESTYHEFIRRHANLFPVNSLETYFAISKLKLGSFYEVDFAIPREEHSLGLYWNLIEIKRPQEAPFTKSGVPSATLTKATQQVRDWKRWIRDSKAEANRIFSTSAARAHRNPNFTFTIIIGNRANSERWLEERNQFAEENGIRVRSFDYLTDRLTKRVFMDKAYVGSGVWDNENHGLAIELANPFVEAFSDSEWKRLLRDTDKCQTHFVAANAKYLVAHWPINRELTEVFNRMSTRSP